MPTLAPQAYVLVIALALMGGAIAWAGDAIGYRLGKMRVSIFGLRPRLTATIIGIVSGILVAFLTMTVLAISSQDVRTLLFHIDDIKNRLATLEPQLATTQADAAKARKQSEQLAARVRRLTAQNAAQTQRNRELQNQAAKLAEDVRRAKHDVATTEAALAKTQKQLQAVREELQANRELLQETKKELGESFERSVVAPPAFVVGQILATRIIRAGRPRKVIAAELVKLLFEASDVARRHGATTGANGRAVVVVRFQRKGEKDTRRVDEKERIDDVSSFLSRQPPADYVVGVYAARNIFPGTQGVVDIGWNLNKLVFHRGAVILQVPIDGALPEAQIYELVRDVVFRRLRAVARDAGVLPQPETGEYGEIDLGELLEVTRLVRRRRAPVLVRAVATEDCWTSGPLRVTLELGPQVTP